MSDRTDKQRLDWLATASVGNAIEIWASRKMCAVGCRASADKDAQPWLVQSPDGLRAAIDLAMDRDEVLP